MPNTYRVNMKLLCEPRPRHFVNFFTTTSAMDAIDRMCAWMTSEGYTGHANAEAENEVDAHDYCELAVILK